MEAIQASIETTSLEAPPQVDEKHEDAANKAKEVEQSNPESTINVEEKIKELLMMPKVSEDELKLQAEEDAQKYQFLDSNLDDLFARINKLTEEALVEPALQHKESLQVIPAPLELPLKKHAISEPCKVAEQPVVEAVIEEPKYIGLGVTQPHPEPRDDILSMSLFELGKAVGSGKFGQVCQCRHKKSGTFYAIKKIFKSTIAEYKIQSHLIDELTILHSLDHPNIIKHYACFTDQYHVFMLLEYVDGLGLIKHLKSSEKKVSNIICQVVKALIYLHERSIMHRDLKPENILYEYGVVKLCDFGWATSYKQTKSTTFCGTLDYLSPEVAAKLPYDCSVDVWSVGVLTYQLLCGKVPFKDADKQAQMKKILECDEASITYPEEIGPEAQQMIKRLLKKSPQERMSLAEVLQHPFITKHNGTPDSPVDPEPCEGLEPSDFEVLFE